MQEGKWGKKKALLVAMLFLSKSFVDFYDALYELVPDFV